MNKILIILVSLILISGGVFLWLSKTLTSLPAPSPQPEATVQPEGEPEKIEESEETEEIEEIELKTETLEVPMDENFTLTLESNQTTGYQWETGFEAGYLELVDKKYILPEEQQIVGAGGQETFTFLPLQSGETEITFLYKRRWEEKEIKRFVYKIVIN